MSSIYKTTDYNGTRWIIVCSAIVELSVQYPSNELKITEKHDHYEINEVYSIRYKNMEDLSRNLQEIMNKIKEYRDSSSH